MRAVFVCLYSLFFFVLPSNQARFRAGMYESSHGCFVCLYLRVEFREEDEERLLILEGVESVVFRLAGMFS
jgi:hypothetical protein